MDTLDNRETPFEPEDAGSVDAAAAEAAAADAAAAAADAVAAAEAAVAADAAADAAAADSAADAAADDAAAVDDAAASEVTAVIEEPASDPVPEPEQTQVRQTPESLAQTTSLDAVEDAAAAAADGKAAGKKRRWPFVLGALAAVALVVYLLVSHFLLPPAISHDQILKEFNSAFLETSEITDSVYAVNNRYKLSSSKVLSVEAAAADMQTARIQAVYENESFSTVVEASQQFQLVKGEWVALAPEVRSVDATPIAPVDSGRVLADIDNLMKRITPRDGVSFELLYSGASFNVENAVLAEDARSCTLDIKADKTTGLNRYAGTITANFEFVPGKTSLEAGTWQLASVEADPGCWEPALPPIVGTWKGSFESTETSAIMFDTGRCFGGRDAQMEVEVKSFDVASGRAEMTLSFIKHDHAALAQDADSALGDMEFGHVPFTINLDSNSLTGSYHNTSDVYGGDWTITFINDNGTWKAKIRSSAGASENFLWGPPAFTDTYVLERAN